MTTFSQLQPSLGLQCESTSVGHWARGRSQGAGRSVTWPHQEPRVPAGSPASSLPHSGPWPVPQPGAGPGGRAVTSTLFTCDGLLIRWTCPVAFRIGLGIHSTYGPGMGQDTKKTAGIVEHKLTCPLQDFAADLHLRLGGTPFLILPQTLCVYL